MYTHITLTTYIFHRVWKNKFKQNLEMMEGTKIENNS